MLFGKHDLDALDEQDYHQSAVKELIIHPDWNTQVASFDGDIAILVAATTIEYNPYVIPVCLWNNDVDLNKIVNKKGSVVGWGRTEDPVS